MSTFTCAYSDCWKFKFYKFERWLILIFQLVHDMFENFEWCYYWYLQKVNAFVWKFWKANDILLFLHICKKKKKTYLKIMKKWVVPFWHLNLFKFDKEVNIYVNSSFDIFKITYQLQDVHTSFIKSFQSLFLHWVLTLVPFERNIVCTILFPFSCHFNSGYFIRV